jgi:hypothetical protein
MMFMKGQSAMEYLMTYGWAILVAAVVIVVIFGSGILNPSLPEQCILQAGFQCLNSYMAQNGVLSINIIQITSSPINVTAVGCNENESVLNMQPYNPNIMLQIDSNYTFNVQCYTGSGKFTGTPGASFKGFLLINYTNIETGLPQIAYGQIVARVT